MLLQHPTKCLYIIAHRNAIQVSSCELVIKNVFQASAHFCRFIKYYTIKILDTELRIVHQQSTASVGNFTVDNLTAFTEYTVTIVVVNDANLTGSTSKVLVIAEAGIRSSRYIFYIIFNYILVVLGADFE